MLQGKAFRNCPFLALHEQQKSSGPNDTKKGKYKMLPKPGHVSHTHARTRAHAHTAYDTI